MFEYLRKGKYVQDGEIFYTMLRGNEIFALPFKLYHPSLKTRDKYYFLGQTKYESKI